MSAARRTDTPVQTGLEVLLETPARLHAMGRIGLLCNQASVDRRLNLAVDLLSDVLGDRLRAIFSPQHGLWGEQQANMIETPHGVHPRLGIPIHSLYSETRRPDQAMLADIDTLVIDLQDVGTRVYTFIWTLMACLQACQTAGKAVVVLDRPNPIGGDVCEGPMIDEGYESFVGNSNIPLRHAMTIGEIAGLLRSRHAPSVAMEVVPMRHWRRDLYWDAVGLPWVWPSPNMQRLETAVVYPGQVLLEGTNLSEGRGTTLPFEVIGAPGLDPWAVAEQMKSVQTPGVTLRVTHFRPTFDKWQDRSCGGLQIHIDDPAAVRSVRLTMELLRAIGRVSPQTLRWLPPPYEYEFTKPPIDILFGSPRLRQVIDQGGDWDALIASLRNGLDDFVARRSEFLLY